ncbi:WD40 repeat domain-containing protein [Nonomuraea jiangxiensis]|uniref:WD40 repeat n=1 Tax=Nonomuraea jiangxiensis TaxID=633440 RepID=A0A1G9QX70_9ACTN|nr:hypothetical protein [Nonomuraea jiangxiensis]SDM15553.1 WD40 repeat [Nonomuraea jiangxiensis]
MASIGRWAAVLLLCAPLLGCSATPAPKPVAPTTPPTTPPTTTPAWAAPDGCSTTKSTPTPLRVSTSYALDSGGHSDVTTVDFGLLEGRPVAISAGVEGTVRFWSLPGFAPAAKPLPGTAATYVPLGQRAGVLTTGDSGGRLWDLAARRIVLHFPKDSVYALGDYRGVQALFVSDGRTVRIWNPGTRALIGTLVTTGVRAMAVGRMNGRPILVAYEGEEAPFRIWDLTTRRRIGREFFINDEYASADWMRITDIGGVPVLLVRTYQGILQWDLNSQKPRSVTISRGVPDNPDEFASAALSGEPAVLAAGEENHDGHVLTRAVPSAVTLWDPGNGGRLATLAGHGGTVTALATGRLKGAPVLLSGSEDNTVRLWDLRTHRQIGPPSPSGPVNGVETAALADVNGRSLAVTAEDDGTLRAWDAATGRPVGAPFGGPAAGAAREYAGYVTVTEVDGIPVAVVADRPDRLTVWNLRDFTQLARVAVPRQPGDEAPLGSLVAVRRDGRPLILTATQSGGRLIIHTTDLAGRRLIDTLDLGPRPMSSNVETSLSSVGGQAVAVATRPSGKVQVWDVATKQRVSSLAVAPLPGERRTGGFHVGRVGLFGCRPALFATREDSAMIRVLDPLTGADLVPPIDAGSAAGGLYSAWVGPIATVRGRTLALVSVRLDDTGHTRLWDLTARTPLTKPAEKVYSRAFAADDRHVIAPGPEERMLVWPLKR